MGTLNKKGGISMRQPITEDFLKAHGFTDCDTSLVTRRLGIVYWYLGEDGFISNSNLLITKCENGTFLVRYRSYVGYGLRYLSELKMALKLFKCEDLVNI